MQEINHIKIGSNQLLVLKADEAEENLLSIVQLSENEHIKFSLIQNPQRRRIFLATRIILRKLGIQELTYSSNGKPFCKDGHISISHSGEYVAVYFSSERAVGVDIEKIHPRIHKIKDRFLSDFEKTEICLDETENLIISWSVKEAIFKKYGAETVFFQTNQHLKSLDKENKRILVSYKSQGILNNEELGYINSADNFIIVHTL